MIEYDERGYECFSDKFASFTVNYDEKCAYYFKIMKTKEQEEAQNKGKSEAEKSETMTVLTKNKRPKKERDTYKIKLLKFNFLNG